MKNLYSLSITLLIVLTISSCRTNKPLPSPAALPSWENALAKNTVISFVSQATNPGKTMIDADFRTALIEFDSFIFSPTTNDLKNEFLRFTLNKMVEKDSNLIDKTPYKEIINRDKGFFTEDNPIERYSYLINAHWNESTPEEYNKMLGIFYVSYLSEKNLKNMRALLNPKGIDLINYLQRNNFTIYIYADCNVDLVRPLLQRYLNIAPENVLGENIIYSFDSEKIELNRTMKITDNLAKNKESLASLVYRKFGRKPLINVISNEINRSLLQVTHQNSLQGLDLIFINNPSTDLIERSKQNGWLFVN
ncbi:MAG: hypothetical protein B7C24_13245 [Bacteroidetes bacterium 4572_77]|nr:MAG: hypothetical protein B7C24_13245 [Bacteroidetes bacterium 4572_77]